MIFVWTFSPVLVSVGPITIRWYGVLFVAAFLLGQAFLSRAFASEGIAKDRAEALLLYALIGAVVGARLAHCLLYDPSYYIHNPLAILRVWEGGLASHGGVIGVLIGLWVASRKFDPRVPFLWLLDRAAIPAAFGASLIRVANFLNSEIVGIPTSGTWGVVFTSVDQLPRHPVQAYEAISYAISGIILWLMYRRLGKGVPHGLLVGWLLVLVFSMRIILEIWKVPQAAYEAGQALSVGQYLSLPFIAVGVASIVYSKCRLADTDGAAAEQSHAASREP
jgi:phosphatidylglycerol---prolipoprotein diacylglyceryl transferase